jgi:hypothetical protein
VALKSYYSIMPGLAFKNSNEIYWKNYSSVLSVVIIPFWTPL